MSPRARRSPQTTDEWLTQIAGDVEALLARFEEHLEFDRAQGRAIDDLQRWRATSDGTDTERAKMADAHRQRTTVAATVIAAAMGILASVVGQVIGLGSAVGARHP